MAKVRSYSGKMVDFDELKSKNKNMMTAGNMNVNVAGDVVDEFGNVVMKASELAKKEYNKTEKAVVSSSLFDDIDEEEYKIVDDPNVLKKKASKIESKTPSKSIKKNDEVIHGEESESTESKNESK